MLTFAVAWVRWPAVMLGSMLALCTTTSAAANLVSELDDAQARAQYAFYTADVRTLQEIAQAIEHLDVSPELVTLKAYGAAYAYWKLAELHAQEASPGGGRAGQALSAKAAQSCLGHTAAALHVDSQMTETYVLDAACAMLKSEGRTRTKTSKPACIRNRSLQMALQLGSGNPRVLLIEARCLQDSDPSSIEALERLQKVVAAFDTAPLSRPGTPDWGQAEALLLLGEFYLQRGEAHAARDSIEKALVIAPDYRKARELLNAADLRPR